MNLNILFEDNQVIAVEKEAGILTQRDSSGVLSLLDHVKNYIKDKYKKPGNVFLGLVHRLDRPVSGIVVFARTSKSAQRLHHEFAERRVVKMYMALIEDNTSLEKEKWIERKDNLVRARGFSKPAGNSCRRSKSASMRIMRLVSNGAYSLILVHILTGRKHQIRAQLAAMGLPIVGDEKYGSRLSCTKTSICLHAIYIKFAHPTKKIPVEIYSTPPEHFSEKMTISRGLLKAVKNAILMESNRIDQKQQN